jgi:hypothetical protein
MEKKVYMKEWREANKDKVAAHITKFQEKSKEVKCPCGGKYRENYSEKKHNATKKHLLYEGGKVEVPTEKSITAAEVALWFKDRHQEIISKRNPDNKTAAVDKNSSLWKKISAHIGEEKITEKYLSDNAEKIVETNYSTPSSQQTALATIRLIMKHYFQPTDEVVEKLGTEIKAKEAEHIESNTGEEALPENMMTFKQARKEAKAHEGKDRELATYFHIHSAHMPVLRSGDWINASTVDTGKNNYIDMEKGTFTRRISKVKKAAPFTFKLPTTVLNHLKDSKVEGDIFTTSANKLHKKLVKMYPDHDVSNRGFRALYSSTEITALKNPKRILHHLEIANHTPSTWLNHYYKGNDPVLNALKSQS